MSEVNSLVGGVGPLKAGGPWPFRGDASRIGPKTLRTDSQSGTGAVRSADANGTRFDLIHPVAMLALARTYAEGAVRYGSKNWEKGFEAHDLLNHAIRHIYMYLGGDRSEPHLPHAAWGLMAAIVSDALWPELNAKHLRGPGCTLTPEALKHQEDGDPERKAKRADGTFDKLGEWNTTDIPEVARFLEQRKGQGVG